MKIRDLFNVIIKVFGFFIIRDILDTVPYLVTPIISMAAGDSDFEMGTLIVTLLIMALYFSIAYVLIFKTDSMLNLLKLEPELSDEYLRFDLSVVNVMTIALIILAGYILINEIPDFCNYLFKYYQQSQIRFQTSKPSISNLVVSAVKILIASLIIGERKRIIQLIQKSEPVHEEEIPGEDLQ